MTNSADWQSSLIKSMSEAESEIQSTRSGISSTTAPLLTVSRARSYSRRSNGANEQWITVNEESSAFPRSKAQDSPATVGRVP